MRFVREHLVGIIVGIIGYELYYRSKQSKGG